jgi:YHS domain-containing protein
MTNPAKSFAFPETVCRRTISGDLRYYPQAEHQGQTIYFCTEYCLHTFLQDPERFYPAHSKRRVDLKKCKFKPREKAQT